MRFGEVTTSEENIVEELRVRKLKNGKAAGGDEITGIGNRVVDWIRIIVCISCRWACLGI